VDVGKYRDDCTRDFTGIATSVVIDDTSIYWADPGRIRKRAR